MVHGEMFGSDGEELISGTLSSIKSPPVIDDSRCDPEKWDPQTVLQAIIPRFFVDENGEYGDVYWESDGRDINYQSMIFGDSEVFDVCDHRIFIFKGMVNIIVKHDKYRVNRSGHVPGETFRAIVSPEVFEDLQRQMIEYWKRTHTQTRAG